MSSTTTSDAQSERAANIYAFIKTLQHVSPPRGRAGASRLPANGRNTGIATNIRGSEAAVKSVQFDCNGDPVLNLCGRAIKKDG